MTKYQDLISERDALDKKIALALKAEKKEALKQVQHLIQQYGFTERQVFPGHGQARKIPPKYRDPETGTTWTGRGRTPTWLNDENKEKFRI